MAYPQSAAKREVSVELISDFSDYYDEYLVQSTAKSRVSYYRQSDNDLTHEESLSLLMDLKLPVPFHGLAKDLPSNIDLVAVHIDDTSAPRHTRCSVMPLSDAKVNHPCAFAVEYIGNIGAPSISFHELHVGRHTQRYECRSDHPWSSVRGNSETKLLGEIPSRLAYKISEPVYVLDYVVDTRRPSVYRQTNRMYYLDCRVRPKISETPVAAKVSPKRAAQLIRESLRNSFADEDTIDS